MTTREKEIRYRRLNGRYLKDAEQLIKKGDYAQASEKLWGAAAEIVKAVGAKHDVELGTHASLWEYVSKLDKENPGWNLRRDFSYAGNLHQNFYEDWLPKEYVKDGVTIVKGFVKKLETLL
jgi:hypothetical protein